MTLFPPSVKRSAERKSVGIDSPVFIETNNLNLFYGKKQVLENINLRIDKGEITAIVGPSGCGKTSFLSALNRLNDLNPLCRISGKIRVEGQDIHSSETNGIQLRRRIGMIFQQPVPFPFSIRKNMTFAPREHGLKNRDKLEEITEMVLQDVGLWDEVKDRLDQPAQALSGGQQQRLCIARALALEPEALLMDEPCSALDPLSSGVVEDLILNLKGRYTIVIVTHNLAQARRISDQCAFFFVHHETGVGHLIERGPTNQIFNAPKDALTAAYVSGARG